MKRLRELILVGLFLAIASTAMAVDVNVFMDAKYGSGTWGYIPSSSDQVWEDLNNNVTVIGLNAGTAGTEYWLGYNHNDVGPIVLGTNIWFTPMPFIVGSTETFNIADNADLFIWAFLDRKTYIDLVTGNQKWYSLESVNTDGLDHMQAFTTGKVVDGLNVYAIAWQYQVNNNGLYDFIVEVQGAKPYSAVPEPATMLLFGLGLLGLAGVRRKLKK